MVIRRAQLAECAIFVGVEAALTNDACRGPHPLNVFYNVSFVRESMYNVWKSVHGLVVEVQFLDVICNQVRYLKNKSTDTSYIDLREKQKIKCE
jgi:hypothetical protein